MTAPTMASSTGLSPQIAIPLAYSGWWLTGMILWFVERRDHTIRFHAAQSIAAFGLIAVGIAGFAALALASLSFVPAAFTWFLWAAVVSWAAGVLLWIAVMWKAATGRVWRIPIAAELADQLVRRP